MKVRATLSFALRVAPEEAALLLETMRTWREAVRHVVDFCLTTKRTGLGVVHRALYRLLRERYGLPSRLALDAERQGIWIAKGWLKNPRKGRRPIIRGLWMVLTPRQSYTFRWTEASILTLKGRKTFRLVYIERWHGRYRSWKVKEARLVAKDGRIWLKVVVESEVELIKPERTLGVDINYSNITLSDGTRIELTAFRRAFQLKIQAERMMKRHRRSWRYIRAVRTRIRALGAKARRVVEDACRKAANLVVSRALETRAAIILEDLRGLELATGKKGRKWRARLTLWAYRELQRWICWKAELAGVPVFKVNPKGTSSTCPRCGSKLTANGYRRLRCSNCGLEADRDYIAALNLSMRGFPASLMAPERMQSQEAMRGN